MKRPTWDIPIGEVIVREGNRHYSPRNFKFTVEYEIIDNEKLKFRKGDVVNLCGSRIPNGAQNETAVVLERYRLTKIKPWRTYHDYGMVLMVLTGVRKGHIFKLAGTHYPSKLRMNVEDDFGNDELPNNDFIDALTELEEVAEKTTDSSDCSQIW